MNQGIMGMFAGLGEGVTKAADNAYKDYIETQRLKLRARLRGEERAEDRAFEERLIDEERQYQSEMPKKPLVVNDQIVDPKTGEVIGDYRDRGESKSNADWRKLNDGSLYNQRTGETISVGGQMAGAGNDGTGGLDSSVMSQIQQTTRNFHGAFNPDGSFMGIPDGAREKYTLAMQRAQELVSKGNMPVFEATNLANLSVSDPLTEDQARALAKQEAEQEITGFFKGDERDAYVKSRTKELMQESRGAQERYNQIVNGAASQSGRPEGLITRATRPVAPKSGGNQPPVVRSDEDYEKLAPGTVFVDETGKRYQKPE